MRTTELFILEDQGSVSRKSRKRFGLEKPFVKLRPAYSVKLAFWYVVKEWKIKIIANFRASTRRRVEDTKRSMWSKMRPKSFGTFEKRSPGSNCVARKNSVQQNWCVGFADSPIRPTSSDMLKVPFVWWTKLWGKKRERCGYRYHRLGHFSPLSVIFMFVGCWTIRRQSYALAKGVQYVIISVYYFNHYFCRPLIQNKLEVLGKAGLSEEELDADCTFFKVSNPVHVPPSLSLKRIHQNFCQLQQTWESKWTNHIMMSVRPLWRRVNQS